MSEILASLFQGSQTQDKTDGRYELAVLTRMSDNEGWSDEKFTEALKRLAKKKNAAMASQAPPTPKTSTTLSGQNELVGTAKRQETVRITRQADSEGWSDDKTLAALRLRNSIHHELREKRRPDITRPTEP